MNVLFLSLVIAGCTGAASAEVAARPADVLAQAILATPVSNARASRPSLDLTSPRPQASRFADPLPAGIARTSIDHRFDDDGAVGSAGYLCGLQPGEKMYGAAGAAGYDPKGKFLGAKLSVAFR